MGQVSRTLPTSLLILLVSFNLLHAPAEQPHPIVKWVRLLEGEPNAVSWNASNTQIVFSTGYPNSANEIRIVDVATAQILFFEVPEINPITIPYWSPDGRWIAIGTDRVYLIDPEANTVESIYDPPLEYGGIYDLRWNNSLLRLAVYTLTDVGQAHIIVIDPEMRQVESAFQVFPDGRFGWSSNQSTIGFDWSPDGELFAIPNPLSLSIGFWTRSGKLLEQMDVDLSTSLQNPEFRCFSTLFETNDTDVLRWDTTSRTLAMGSYYGLGLCTLNDDGTILHQAIDESPTYSLAWSPDGKWLTSGEFLMDPNSPSCEVRFFDVHNDYQRIESTIGPEVCSVYYLAWSSDSKRLAAATSQGLWIGEVQ